MLKKLEPGSYYGTTERRYDGGGLTVAESVFPSGLDIPRHEHTNAFYGLIVEGCCTSSLDYRSRTERPFTLRFFPAGQAHAHHWHEGGRILHIELARPWLERLQGRTTILDRPAHYDGGPQVWLAKRLFEECRRQDDVTSLAVEGLVLELLAECSRSRGQLPQTSPPRWLGHVCELLHNRFAERLSLVEVAAAAGVSADHLTRSFCAHNGCTVGEYVRRLRVEFACRQLTISELSLVEIALDAGFTDQSHFTKTFQRLMGVTPKVFRKLHSRRKSHTKG